MVQVIPIFDVIGTIAFLIGLFFALKNYNKTKEISNYWLIFSVAMLLGFIWAGSVTLEWLGVYTEIIDEAQQAIVASAATAFAIAALETAISLVQPLD